MSCLSVGRPRGGIRIPRPSTRSAPRRGWRRRRARARSSRPLRFLAAAILLLAFPSAIPASFAPFTHPLGLHASDFRRFSNEPLPATSANATSWSLPAPSQPRADGRLAVDDAVSLRAYPLVGFSFSATFLSATSALTRPSQFGDELVVFAATDATTFHGFEFGVRQSLSDGFVYAYSQYPNPLGGVVFQELPIFANDGRAHDYQLSLLGAAISFTVDGALAAVEFYPVGPVAPFHVVATAHRASGGWEAQGVALSVSDVVLRLSSAE